MAWQGSLLVITRVVSYSCLQIGTPTPHPLIYRPFSEFAFFDSVVKGDLYTD